jgi:hypothetical protein
MSKRGGSVVGSYRRRGRFGQASVVQPWINIDVRRISHGEARVERLDQGIATSKAARVALELTPVCLPPSQDDCDRNGF